MIIDTHCHLYLPEYSQDIQQIIARAEAAGVQRFYLPAINSETITAMLSLEEQYPGKCISMIGLHPCSVQHDADQELSLVQQWLSRRPFAAIGEIGLDFYHDVTYKDAQYLTFRKQCDWALE